MQLPLNDVRIVVISVVVELDCVVPPPKKEKKVLLCERKRHTAGRVASTHCAFLSLGEGPTLDQGRYPLTKVGTPLHQGRYLPPPRQGRYPPNQGRYPPVKVGTPPPCEQTHRRVSKHYLPHSFTCLTH